MSFKITKCPCCKEKLRINNILSRCREKCLYIGNEHIASFYLNEDLISIDFKVKSIHINDESYNFDELSIKSEEDIIPVINFIYSFS